MNAHPTAPRFNLRFSVKGAICMMAAAGVGAAAFRDASRPWMTICTSAALVSIFFAIIAAIYGRRDRQAFWTGFAICAAAYFLFVVRFKDSDIVANLVTTKAIGFVTDQTHPYLTKENSGQPNANPNPPPPAGSRSAADVNPRAKLAVSLFYSLAFLQVIPDYVNMRVGDDVANDIIVDHQTAVIGHSQCSLVLGLLGGLLAQGFAASKPRRKDARSSGFQSVSKGAFDAVV